MKPNERFLKQPKHFWANLRALSEQLRYANSNTRQIKVYSIQQMRYRPTGLKQLGLADTHICQPDGTPTTFGQLLLEYVAYRADVLNTYVEPRLMDLDRAKQVYESLFVEPQPKRPAPLNKQRGEKRTIAYLTAIVNMIIESRIGEADCNYDPRHLTTFTLNEMPLRTFARRVDGAFPGVVNPLAVWEIKEYYHTTSFGSRIADGVYESLLDGLEIEELREHEDIDVKHYLMVDPYRTWWLDGRS